MENKKITTVVGIVLLIIIVITILYFVQKAMETNTPTPTPIPVAVVPNKPAVTPKDDKEILPTVEMGNAVGVVQAISSDKLTVKTDKEEVTLSIKGTINVYAFAQKGTEQKSFSDVKVGSKVSVQYSQEKVVKSMYLLK